jgi:hypothetical protein
MSAPEREPAEPRRMPPAADTAQLAHGDRQMLAIACREEVLARAYAPRKLGGSSS